jgi:rod shape determining protein RodA
MLRKAVSAIDWILIGAVSLIMVFGLVTMYSFTGADSLFVKQIVWCGLGIALIIGMSFIDLGFLKDSKALFGLFIFGNIVLVSLFVIGDVVNGAQSWINLGPVSLQPSDLVKVILILVLAKYFSRRHVAIGNLRHIIVSGIYLFIPFILVLMQPDSGSALVLGAIWFGMILVSGINKRHLFALLGLGLVMSFAVWMFLLKPYQKARIVSFIHPLEDIQGAGYNAYQSTVAVGSGQLLGKGVGYGTQSRLNFLPEYQTDFIFAAFAEEWGFVGSLMAVLAFGVIIWRILRMSILGASNFETLAGVGVVMFFMVHIIVNIGMNIGIMPITGIPLPFMSYGGSHIIAECLALGILVSMSRYARRTHRADLENEFIGM